MCQGTCQYFSVCGGGEPVNKLAENGTFASTETKYCRLTKMRPTDLVLEAIERAQQSGGGLDTSDSAQLARVSAHEGLGKQW
jgi:uncharacterized protein